MLKIGATQTYADPLLTGINDIQELSKTHEVVSKAKAELWHRLLTHYLPLYFPEATRLAGNSRSDWFLAFLEAFPTPACITALTKEAFITYHRCVGRRWQERQGDWVVLRHRRHLSPCSQEDRRRHGSPPTRSSGANPAKTGVCSIEFSMRRCACGENCSRGCVLEQPATDRSA